MRAYHRRTVQRADAAAATGQLGVIYTSMIQAGLVWILPALLAVVICWTFGLTGVESLYLSVPLVALSIFGCCGYVGWIYARALKRTR